MMKIKELKHEISRPNHNHGTRHVGDHGPYKESGYVDQNTV